MNTLDAIDLSDGLLWPDRYDWQAVAQSATPSVTGRVVIQRGRKTGGRPIVLLGPVWLTTSQINELHNKADAGVDMVLTWQGTSYNVVFDYDNNPVDARPLWDKEITAGANDTWELKALRFITTD